MIKYDIPIEVTEKQYHALRNGLPGLIAPRQENGRFFIKVWFMSVAPMIEKFLNTE